MVIFHRYVSLPEGNSIWFVCRCVYVRIYIYTYIQTYRNIQIYTYQICKYCLMIISYHIILHIQIYAHIFEYVPIYSHYMYMTLRCIAFLLLRCVSMLFCNGRWELEVSWPPGRFFSWSSLSGHPWPWGLVLGANLETWDPDWFSWFRENDMKRRLRIYSRWMVCKLASRFLGFLAHLWFLLWCHQIEQRGVLVKTMKSNCVVRKTTSVGGENWPNNIKQPQNLTPYPNPRKPL